MQFQEGLTFEDVTLIPQYNNVSSRTHPDTSTWLTKSTKVKIPLIPANMDTVISPQMAEVLIANGTYPIFHRFTSLDTQLSWVKTFPDKCYISCGMKDLSDVVYLLDSGARGVCIDIAHGHSKVMIDTIKELKSLRPNKEIIAGNVCTQMGYQDLVNAGADAVKVGVGGGSACTTRIVTGFGVPQFSAIYNCGKMAEKLRVPLIGDGGIKHSRDVVLSLSAGASTIMMGGVFSKAYESAGQKYYKDGNEYVELPIFNINNDRWIIEIKKNNIYTKYRGQASVDFQNDFYKGLKKNTVAEGIVFYSKCTGTTQDIIDDFIGGLRSGLTYGGSMSIKELQRKAEFMKVSHNFMGESLPRPEILSLK
jgi:IMP dehydrogenase